MQVANFSKGTYKVMQVQTGSKYIKLPVAWARIHNIEKGQELTLTVDSDGRLLVSPQQEAQHV